MSTACDGSCSRPPKHAGQRRIRYALGRVRGGGSGKGFGGGSFGSSSSDIASLLRLGVPGVGVAVVDARGRIGDEPGVDAVDPRIGDELAGGGLEGGRSSKGSFWVEDDVAGLGSPKSSAISRASSNSLSIFALVARQRLVYHSKALPNRTRSVSYRKQVVRTELLNEADKHTLVASL